MKPKMNENFEKLEERVLDSLKDTDLERINYELSRICGPTIVTGVGGSSVVSTFASKVLNEKNGIITISSEPRDIKYMNISNFDNILTCSYSGTNHGVTISFLNSLKHYLLSSKECVQEDVKNLTYICNDGEHSFISLAATLIPCTVLLNYYLGNNQKIVTEHLKESSFDFEVESDIYEIFTGYETSTACKYLESTMVESGIGIPIVHDKYSYCHGRSTISTTSENIAIYFNTSTELDDLLLNELPKYYKKIIVIECSGDILGDYASLIKCMYLTKYIAEQKKKDLSDVDYNPIVKKLYKYNGNL